MVDIIMLYMLFLILIVVLFILKILKGMGIDVSFDDDKWIFVRNECLLRKVIKEDLWNYC